MTISRAISSLSASRAALHPQILDTVALILGPRSKALESIPAIVGSSSKASIERQSSSCR